MERRKTARDSLILNKGQETGSEVKIGCDDERQSVLMDTSQKQQTRDSFLRGDEAVQVNESAVFLPNKLKPSPSTTNHNLKQNIIVNNSIQNDSINIDDKSTKYGLDSSSKKEATGEKTMSYHDKREKSSSELSNVYLNMHAQNVQREREILETLGEKKY
jgi:hypothetical protein